MTRCAIMPAIVAVHWKLRLGKLARIVSVADYRRALLLGIAATTEHAATPFNRRVRTVIDVGANRGQFALFALHHFPQTTVHSFEPLPKPLGKLRQLAAISKGRLIVHDVALGSVSKRAVLHETREDDSSSLLHPSGLVQSRVIADHDIPLRRLDEVVRDDDLADPTLLKADVQGFELEVLVGAGKLLPRFDELFIEVSFATLYRGQALADDIRLFLEDAGFRLASLRPSMKGPDGSPLQADALFRRTGSSGRRS